MRDMTREPDRSLAGHLIEIHEKDWGPGNPGRPDHLLKTITSSVALTNLLWDDADPTKHSEIVRILEDWEARGYVVLAKPLGEEVLVTGVNPGILRFRAN